MKPADNERLHGKRGAFRKWKLTLIRRKFQSEINSKYLLTENKLRTEI